MPRRHYKWILRGIGIAVLILILCKIDRQAVGAILLGTEKGLLFASAALFGLHVAVKSLRWHCILSHCDIHVSKTSTLEGYAVGALLGTVTPGRIGELSKAAMIRNWKPESSWGTALGTIVLDRIIDICTFALIGAAGIFCFGLPGPFSINTERTVLLLLTGGGVASLLLWRPLYRSALGKRARSFVRQKLGSSASSFYQVLRIARTFNILPALAWTFGAYILYFLHFSLLAEAAGSDLPFSLLCWGISLASLGALLPISISGIGVRDFILISIFAASGESPERTLAISLLYLAIVYMTIPLMGIWPFLRGKTGFTEPLHPPETEN